MNLLSLLDIGIVLRDTTKSEFVHEVNLVGGSHVFVLENAFSYKDTAGVGTRHTLKSFTIIGKVALNSMT